MAGCISSVTVIFLGSGGITIIINRSRTFSGTFFSSRKSELYQ